MPTFHDRYLAGEHQQVWTDLVALGETVRQEPVYSDALAVARETMRRAQVNIETLIGRLHALGYRFKTEQSAARGSLDRMATLTRQLETIRAKAGGPLADMMKGLLDRVSASPHHREGLAQLKEAAATPPPTHPLDDPSVYARATPQSIEHIADAERRLRGPLPISLRAFYETFEHVSFLGSHPQLNPTGKADAQPMMSVAPSMLQGPGADRRRDLAESLGFRITSQAAPRHDDSALPDPLFVTSLEDLADEVGEDEDGRGSFIISPDDLQKANISGSMYYVDLPDGRADVILQDWRNDYFVTYLRRALAWGGFPGCERHQQAPTALIRELTRELLPL